MGSGGRPPLGAVPLLAADSDRNPSGHLRSPFESAGRVVVLDGGITPGTGYPFAFGVDRAALLDLERRRVVLEPIGNQIFVVDECP